MRVQHPGFDDVAADRQCTPEAFRGRRRIVALELRRAEKAPAVELAGIFNQGRPIRRDRFLQAPHAMRRDTACDELPCAVHVAEMSCSESSSAPPSIKPAPNDGMTKRRATSR